MRINEIQSITKFVRYRPKILSISYAFRSFRSMRRFWVCNRVGFWFSNPQKVFREKLPKLPCCMFLRIRQSKAGVLGKIKFKVESDKHLSIFTNIKNRSRTKLDLYPGVQMFFFGLGQTHFITSPKKSFFFWAPAKRWNFFHVCNTQHRTWGRRKPQPFAPKKKPEDPFRHLFIFLATR